MNQQAPTTQTVPEEKKSDFTVIILDLHENVTEEMLWKHMQLYGKISRIKFPRKQKQKALRSKGYAFVTFQDNSGYQISLEKADQSLVIGKPIRVLPFYEKNKLNEFKKFNLFIKGFGPKSDAQKLKQAIIKELGSEIFSFKLAFDDKKSEMRGYGYCSFLKEEDKQKMISLKQIKIDDQEIQFFEFKKPEPLRNNIYLKEFYNGEISDQLLNDAHQREQFEKQQKEIIEKIVQDKLNKQVAINSIFVKIDPKNKKPFAFICFKDEADAISFNEICHKEKVIYSNIQEPQHKTNQSSNNVLLLKNIRPDADRNKLKEIIERKYGQTTGITQFKEPKKREQQPQNNNQRKQEYKDARQCTVFFKKEDDANKLIKNYTEDKELLELFVDNMAFVNISLKSEEREKYLTTIQFKNVTFANQTATAAQVDEQQQRFQQFPFFPMMGMRPGPMPFQMNQMPMMRPNIPPQQRYQNRYPRQQGYNRNQQFNQQPRNLNQQQMRPPFVQQQQPINNTQPQINLPMQPVQPVQPGVDKNTWEYIKNNLEEFLKRPQQEKRNILGQLIYPKVLEVSSNKANAPKITGMLIDFTVFEEQDVIEFLENPAELKERVVEAEQLIDQNSNTTNASQSNRQ